jgi:hypothetical protein
MTQKVKICILKITANLKMWPEADLKAFPCADGKGKIL